MQVFYSLFISVLQLEIHLSRGKGWDLINWFNDTIFFVPVSRQDLDFQCHILCSLFFVFSERRLFVLMVFVELLAITV